jgi:hypothetical protein
MGRGHVKCVYVNQLSLKMGWNNNIFVHGSERLDCYTWDD